MTLLNTINFKVAYLERSITFLPTVIFSTAIQDPVEQTRLDPRNVDKGQ